MRIRAGASLALAVVLVAAAAACDNKKDSSTTTTTPTTAGAATTAPLSGKGLQLGQLAPPPGLLDELFSAQRRGTSMAASDVAKGGGVLGGPLTITVQSPSTSQTEANVVADLAKGGASGFVGPMSSSAAPAVRDEVVRIKSVACSASASDPAVTYGQTEPTLFRTVVPDDEYATYLGDFIASKRDAAKPASPWKVAIVVRDDAYGRSLSSYLSAALTGRNMAPTVVSYNPATVIFDSYASQVAKVGADLNVLISYEEGPLLLRALLDAKIPPTKLLGLESFFIPRLATIVSPNDPSAINGFAVFGTMGDNAFLARLIEEDPNGQVVFAAQAYDCAIVLALASQAVESGKASTLAKAVTDVTAGGRTCTTYGDCLSKLAAGEDIDYDGPTGKIGIDTKGDPTFARFSTAVWQDGKVTGYQATDVDLAKQQMAAELTAATALTTQIQIALRLAGFYTGPINGIYDEQTAAAVKAFQASVGLPATGVYDAATDQALRAKVGSVAGTLSTSTKQLQQALTDLGFYKGPIDGKWSPELTASVKELQKSLGVPQTGVIDVPTIQAIYAKGVQTGSTTTTAPATTAAPTTAPAATTTVPPTTAAPATTVPPTAPPTTPTTPTTAPPTTPPTTAPTKTILQVLQADPDFSTLVTAVEAAKLGELVVDPAVPYTVFAPTNEAFAKIPQADLDKLLGDITALRKLLTYHIVPNVVLTAEQLKGPEELATANGKPLAIAGSVATNDLVIGDGAKLVPKQSNLVATNGIVQGIDKVLTPPA